MEADAFARVRNSSKGPIRPVSPRRLLAVSIFLGLLHDLQHCYMSGAGSAGGE